MSVSDIIDVVDVHNKAFRGFFLTKMGPRFLRSYYKTVLNYKENISLVACDHESKKIIGFAVGFKNSEAFYMLFRERRRELFFDIVFSIVRSPSLLFDVLRNVRRVGTPFTRSLNSIELSSIGVAVKGIGVGAELLKVFCNTGRDAGAVEIFLTTDADGNDDVRRFYETHGFAIQGYEFRGKRRLCQYVLKLDAG